jgi:hypothetical protein
MTPEQFQNVFVAAFLRCVQQRKPHARICVTASALHLDYSFYMLSLETEYASDKDRQVQLLFSSFQDGTLKISLTTIAHEKKTGETPHVGESGNFHMLAAHLAQGAFNYLALAS